MDENIYDDIMHCDRKKISVAHDYLTYQCLSSIIRHEVVTPFCFNTNYDTPKSYFTFLNHVKLNCDNYSKIIFLNMVEISNPQDSGRASQHCFLDIAGDI